MTILFFLGNFLNQYFIFTASLVLQILGFCKDMSEAVTLAKRSDDPPGSIWQWQLPSFLGTFFHQNFLCTASLALQMLGFYKELWLSGAVTLPRWSDDPRLYLKRTIILFLGNFCSTKFPIYCFPGKPDVRVLQGAVAVWSCSLGQKVIRLHVILLKWQCSPLLVTFVIKYFPPTASLALQMLGLY